MRVLVTGGAGMLGSALCRELLHQGREVICLDNFITGRRENIEALTRHSRFRFIEHDVINELPPLGTVDRVYHLASPASPPGYARAPIQTLRVNSEGTRRLLEYSRLAGARFLFASTSEAYGDPQQHPQTEDYRGNVSTTGPRSVYDEAKRYGEAITMAYVRSFGLDGRIVRIFNTYGPGCDLHDGRLVANLALQALENEPLTVYGDGSQTRSLCFVSDMVAGLVRTMESPRARGEVINLGNPEEHTVLHFAELIRELVGSDAPIRFASAPVGDDPRLRCPDISKARALLRWESRVSLRQGLSITIEWFRGELARAAQEADAEYARDAAPREAQRPARGGIPALRPVPVRLSSLGEGRA